MSSTTITGTIRGVSNTALANKWIVFRLDAIGTDSVATVTVAPESKSIQTDASGNFSFVTWNNGDSGTASLLGITIDGLKERFVVIPTGTATIELWDLLENYPAAAADPQLPTSSSLFVRKANNLSDLANAGTARTNLGVAIGSNVQAHSAVLDATTASFLLADETKLDGIQTSADVTDATTVTAAGALMDSELASIADVKALNQSLVSGASPVLTIANQTLDDTSLVVAKTTNMQTFAQETDHSLLKARGTGFHTSYVSTVAIGGTTFAQPFVDGEIYSDQGYYHVEYAGATGITVTDLTAESTYVYIDNASALQQQTTEPTRQDWSRKMFTMRISVNTATNQIINFEYLNNPIGHYANTFRDMYSYLLDQGVSFKKGQAITGRGGDLGFDVAAGSLFELGGTGDINNPNIRSFDAVANATYSLLSRTAIVGDETNLVKFYDNAGTITALGSTTVVGHRVYRFSSGNLAMQYGQGNYANMTLAQAGAPLEDYVLNPRLLNATLFGWWFIQETATNTGGSTLTFFKKYSIGIS